MDQIVIIIRQIYMLALVCLIGFIAGKTGYLPVKTGKYVAGVLIKITAPLLIFTTLILHSFKMNILKEGFAIYIATLIILLCFYFFGEYSKKIFQFSIKTEAIYKAHFVFGNVVYLAFPLIYSLYGDKGMIISLFFNLASDTLLWTLGIKILRQHHQKDQKDSFFKHMINANSLAFIGGFIIMIVKSFVHVNIFNNKYFLMILNPTIESFNSLGKTTIYLSMIFIGFILSEVKFDGIRGLMKRKHFFLSVPVKLLIFPLISFFILKMFTGIFEPVTIKIIVLQLAMPFATIIPALALQYESDYVMATEGVFISTIMAFVTLPLIVAIIN